MAIDGYFIDQPVLLTHVMTDKLVTKEMEHSMLRGLRENDAVSFKGGLYAANTGAGNRFTAPCSLVNWTGVRDALNTGDRSVQEQEKFADASVLA